MKAVDLIVIGGGPAGLAATAQAARLGASVALIDESRNLGGKVLGPFDGGIGSGFADRIEKTIAKRLFQELAEFKTKISVYPGTAVWDVDAQGTVTLYLEVGSAKPPERLQGRKLIIAAGAIERVVPFAGWTLPGVYSVGGLNTLVKKGIVPGERFLIAGSGPLQLVLANHLIDAGARVSGIVNTVSRPALWTRALPLLLGLDWLKLRSGFDYLHNLLRHKIPLYHSHVLCKAYGSRQVEQAEIVRVDGTCRPIDGSKKILDVDAVAYGYGLIPCTVLTRLCGCEHRYDDQLGYWRAVVNERMETTLPGIFVAGDGRTIKGYAAAIEEGRLAAVEACLQLGCVQEPEARRLQRPALAHLKRSRRFGRLMDILSAPGAGIYDVLNDETIVCRCEEVTARDVAGAVADGARDLNDLKRRTRLGMGHCQGRICGQVANELLWKMTGVRGPREVFTPRIPAKPVPFGCLAGQ